MKDETTPSLEQVIMDATSISCNRNGRSKDQGGSKKRYKYEFVQDEVCRRKVVKKTLNKSLVGLNARASLNLPS